MERLCKVYKHPCTQMYRQEWAKVETCSSSFMPYVGHLLLRLLDLSSSNNCHDTVVHVHDGVKNDICKRMSIGIINNNTTLKSDQSCNLEQKQESRKNIFASILTRMRDMDPRMKRVLDVVTWMVDCQRRAQGYNFPGHSFTKEFLLKTRYREDRENFFISLKLEPSMITWTKEFKETWQFIVNSKKGRRIRERNF